MTCTPLALTPGSWTQIANGIISGSHGSTGWLPVPANNGQVTQIGPNFTVTGNGTQGLLDIAGGANGIALPQETVSNLVAYLLSEDQEALFVLEQETIQDTAINGSPYVSAIQECALYVTGAAGAATFFTPPFIYDPPHSIYYLNLNLPLPVVLSTRARS